MSAVKTYPVTEQQAENALLTRAQYLELYEQSLHDPETFWSTQAKALVDWFTPWDKLHSGDFATGDVKWFEGAKLNVSHNCLDRHLETIPDQAAIIWEGDEPDQTRIITYRELHEEVSRVANALKGLGVRRGNRVCIYLPMIPEAAIAMLACTRIGAVHSIVFAGFSADALRKRIVDFESSIVITADQCNRGGQPIRLKDIADEACQDLDVVRKMIVVKHTNADIQWIGTRDVWYHEMCKGVNPDCPPEEMDAEDPLFIIYTSGSLGTPKGAVHTTGGYLLWAALTHKYAFDHHEGDIIWCTANIGWITGHTYFLYGPLANGGTTLMYEGFPTYPNENRVWDIIDKHDVTTFYTAPTTLRSLLAYGDESIEAHHLSSLRLLGSVGEQINPDVWEWFYHVVGNDRCPIIDTWWQTGTGGIMICPLAGVTDLKPGSSALPLFGVEPALLDDDGQEMHGEGEGHLVIKRSWPGQVRAVFGDQKRFVDTYFSKFPGNYSTGDRARRDADGYYWVIGRQDDIIQRAGRKYTSSDIENTLLIHPQVAEAAVVGYPANCNEQHVYAFVTLMNESSPSDELRDVLIGLVASVEGRDCAPEQLQWARQLPKTRSGKILRSILQQIAANEVDNLGDISMLFDPRAVKDLVIHRLNQ
ncbi:MAG TPA: acetate--CoA ligase [Gammaproteobacteria bacterium]|nr:acetate--CoA ligase [Gammaproteobacteria bacterium]